MIAGPTGSSRDRTHEAEVCQIKLVDEQIDDANKVIRADPVLQPFWKKHRLAALNALDETDHANPPATEKA